MPPEARKASAAGERRGLALAAKGQQSEGADPASKVDKANSKETKPSVAAAIACAPDLLLK